MPAATPVWRARTADRVLATIEEHRATWQFWHLWAETQRQLRGADIHPADLREVAASVMEEAIARSVRLTPADDPADVPPEERRADGASVFTVAGSTQYTSTRILAAEQRVHGRGCSDRRAGPATRRGRHRPGRGGRYRHRPGRRAEADGADRRDGPPPGPAGPRPGRGGQDHRPQSARRHVDRRRRPCSRSWPRPPPRLRSSPRPPASPPTPWPGSPGRSTTANLCRTGPTGSVRRPCC